MVRFACGLQVLTEIILLHYFELEHKQIKSNYKSVLNSNNSYYFLGETTSRMTLKYSPAVTSSTEITDDTKWSQLAYKVLGLWVQENCETIWASYSDSNVRVWSGNEGKLMSILKGHEDSITCLGGLNPQQSGYQSTSCLLATGSADKTIRIWDIRVKKPLIHTLRGHTDSILTLSWSDDDGGGEAGAGVVGRGTLGTLVSGSKDKTVKIWDMRAGR